MPYSHRPNNIINIRDWKIGIQTYGDTSDTNKFNTIKNLEVDKPGMLYKRATQYRKTSTDTDIIHAKKWWNDNLSNDASWITFGTASKNYTSGSLAIDEVYTITTYVAGDNFTNVGAGSNATGVTFTATGTTPTTWTNGSTLTNATVDKIQLFHPTTFAWTSILKTFSDSGGTCQIIPSNESVRFANCNASDVLDRTPGIYIYNHDTKFFLGNQTESVGFSYEDAQLKYLANWSYQTIIHGTQGNLPTGHYYYKFVPVYDGIQEMPFEANNNAYIYADSDNGSTLRIPLKITKTQWNPRIKSIKVYRGYAKENIEVSYKHIKTIDVNTDTGDAGSTQNITTMTGVGGTSGHVILIDDSKTINFGAGEYTKAYWEAVYPAYTSHKVFVSWTDIEGKKRYAEIISGGANYAVLDAGSSPDLDRLWLGNYDVIFFWEDAISSPGSILTGDEPVDQGDEGCIGNNVLWDNTKSPDWYDNQFNNWECEVTSGNDVVVTGNYGNVFQLSGDHGRNAIAHNIEVDLDDTGADYFDDGTYITITITDTGYADGSSHPLDGIEKAYINYKYGCIHNGRLFGGNIRLDPDDEAEDHPNWIGYSEFEQYDIMPVSNIIPFVDKRGGKITGMISSGGYLVVFTETGVFRLNVPSIDPGGWEVEHAIETMGCTASDSIMEAEGIIFFSNEAGLFALSPHDFRIYDLINDIKQNYLDSGTLTDTSLTYDPEKRRVLCKFGSTKTTTYCFDIEQFLANNNPSWTTMTMTGSAGKYFRPDFISVDENLDVWTFDRYDGTNTQINQLYGGSTGTQELMSTALRSPWYASNDMDFNTIWRRLQLVLKQTLETSSSEDEDVTINIYLNKDESIIEKTITFNADNATLNGVSGRVPYRNIDYEGQIIELIYRLSRRATFIQFEITTTATSSTGLEIHKIELTEDD